MGGGGHSRSRRARVGCCVARGAAASWAISLFVGLGGWMVAMWRRRRGAGLACNTISPYVEGRGMALVCAEVMSDEPVAGRQARARAGVRA